MACRTLTWETMVRRRVPMLTTQDKLRIINAITDEKELRDEVVVPILRQTPGIQKVIKTHGADELGKDIVTVEEDRLGSQMITAFIIKSKRFSRSTTAKADRDLLVNVDNEVRTAITSGFESPELGGRRYFNKIVILTSQALPQAARAYLNDVRAQYPTVAFQYVDDDELRLWTDKYLPDLYYVRDGALAAYFKRLSTKCAKHSEHERIQIYKGEIRDVADIYVPPKLYRTSRVIKGGVAVSNPVISPPETVVEQRKHLLVVAGAGGGKSTLLRSLAQGFLARNRRNEAAVIPILVKAHELSQRLAGRSLSESLQLALSDEFGTDAPTLAHLLPSTKHSVRLLIDGMDEIASTEEQVTLCGALAEFAASYPNAKVVVTTRYAGDAIMGALSTGFVRWDLVWWYRGVIRRFAGKWFKNKEAQDNFLAALYEHDLMSRLPTTPLVLTMLAILYDFGETGLPGSLPELYQMISDLLLGKWSLERRAATMYKENQKEFFLTSLAAEMHSKRTTSIAMDEFAETVARVSAQLGEQFDADEMLHETADVAGLITVVDNARVEFRHLSFQEFYAAKHLDAEAIEDVDSYLAGLFGDPWMASIAYFYAGLRKADIRLLTKLREAIGNTRTSDIARMILEFGYVLQASYLTPMNERLNALVDQVLNYGQFIARMIADGAFPEDVPAWFMVMACVHMFCSTYRSGHWRNLESRVVELVAQRTREDDFAGLTSRLLAALITSDETACADELMKLEPSLRGVPILYVSLEAELSSHLADEGNPRLQAMRASLVRIQKLVRRRINDYPKFFAEAFHDRKIKQLAAAAQENLAELS